MTDFLILQKEYDGTKAWNEAGYDGAGVTVWNMEPNNVHGLGTHQRVLDAAPGATVLNAPHNIATKAGEVTAESVEFDGERVPADQFVRDHDVQIMTQSIAANGKPIKAYVPLYYDLRTRHNLVLFNAAGNDGEEFNGGRLPETEAIYVGACTAFAGNFDDIRACYYSSVGTDWEMVDFSTFVRQGQNGTSFAAPYLAGTAALLRQRYGKSLTDAQVYQYFKMNARFINSGHVCDDRYDFKAGYGIPRLPEVNKKLIRMTVGDRDYWLDDRRKTMDAEPIVRLGRTFVPVSFVALALGAEVTWNAKDRGVTIKKNGQVILLWIGKKWGIVNGKPYELDVAPFIAYDRTMVPVAFIADALDCKVCWVAEEKTVMILEK